MEKTEFTIEDKIRYWKEVRQDNLNAIEKSPKDIMAKWWLLEIEKAEKRLKELDADRNL